MLLGFTCDHSGQYPFQYLKKYWTGNWAIWLVPFSYWPSDFFGRVISLKFVVYCFRKFFWVREKEISNWTIGHLLPAVRPDQERKLFLTLDTCISCRNGKPNAFLVCTLFSIFAWTGNGARSGAFFLNAFCVVCVVVFVVFVVASSFFCFAFSFSSTSSSVSSFFLVFCNKPSSSVFRSSL